MQVALQKEGSLSSKNPNTVKTWINEWIISDFLSGKISGQEQSWVGFKCGFWHFLPLILNKPINLLEPQFLHEKDQNRYVFTQFLGLSQSRDSPKLAQVIDSLVSPSCFHRTPGPKKYPAVPFIVRLGSNNSESMSCYRVNHRPHMVSLVPKPVIPNLVLLPDLIAVSTSPRNIVLIYQCGIFWSTPMR